MKKMSGFLLLLLFYGCLEEYNIGIKNSEPRLVIDGLITNRPGPYFVKLTKSSSWNIVSTNSISNNDEIVKDALVVIYDDTGQIDTLTFVNSDDKSSIADNWLNFGKYQTTKLVGIPGNTYTLKVIIWGKEFTSKAHMMPVPEIDTLSFEKKISEKDGHAYYIPLLSFKEPKDTSNFYLIQLRNGFNANHFRDVVWQFSIISDVFLNDYVNKMNVSLGANPRGKIYPIYQMGDSMYVALSSLTREAFGFYKAVLDQFENDGGNYKPTPTSPPSNISNGGLGLFRASAISEKAIRIQ